MPSLFISLNHKFLNSLKIFNFGRLLDLRSLANCAPWLCYIQIITPLKKPHTLTYRILVRSSRTGTLEIFFKRWKTLPSPVWKWWDSNHGSLVFAATGQPTVPHPLPMAITKLDASHRNQSRHFSRLEGERKAFKTFNRSSAVQNVWLSGKSIRLWKWEAGKPGLTRFLLKTFLGENFIFYFCSGFICHASSGDKQ